MNFKGYYSEITAIAVLALFLALAFSFSTATKTGAVSLSHNAALVKGEWAKAAMLVQTAIENGVDPVYIQDIQTEACAVQSYSGSGTQFQATITCSIYGMEYTKTTRYPAP